MMNFPDFKIFQNIKKSETALWKSYSIYMLRWNPIDFMFKTITVTTILAHPFLTEIGRT